MTDRAGWLLSPLERPEEGGSFRFGPGGAVLLVRFRESGRHELFSAVRLAWWPGMFAELLSIAELIAVLSETEALAWLELSRRAN